MKRKNIFKQWIKGFYACFKYCKRDKGRKNRNKPNKKAKGKDNKI